MKMDEYKLNLPISNIKRHISDAICSLKEGNSHEALLILENAIKLIKEDKTL